MIGSEKVENFLDALHTIRFQTERYGQIIEDRPGGRHQLHGTAHRIAEIRRRGG